MHGNWIGLGWVPDFASGCVQLRSYKIQNKHLQQQSSVGSKCEGERYFLAVQNQTAVKWWIHGHGTVLAKWPLIICSFAFSRYCSLSAKLYHANVSDTLLCLLSCCCQELRVMSWLLQLDIILSCYIRISRSLFFPLFGFDLHFCTSLSSTQYLPSRTSKSFSTYLQALQFPLLHFLPSKVRRCDWGLTRYDIQST